MFKEFKCPNCSSVLNPRKSDLIKCEYCNSVFYYSDINPINSAFDEINKKHELIQRLCNVLMLHKKQKEDMVNLRALWIMNNKCRHCGGKFEGGLFKKRCVKCGKNKDY